MQHSRWPHQAFVWTGASVVLSILPAVLHAWLASMSVMHALDCPDLPCSYSQALEVSECTALSTA